MDIEHLEAIFFENDGYYRVYCEICDNLYIERFYENHLKSQTPSNKSYKRQQLSNTNKNN